MDSRVETNATMEARNTKISYAATKAKDFAVQAPAKIIAGRRIPLEVPT
jgi:hypothetical protein